MVATIATGTRATATKIAISLGAIFSVLARVTMALKSLIASLGVVGLGPAEVVGGMDGRLRAQSTEHRARSTLVCSVLRAPSSNSPCTATPARSAQTLVGPA